VLAALANEPAPAKSLFLPLVPLRKFPPSDPIILPDAVLLSLVTDIAFQTLFPFHFGQHSPPISSEEGFHNYIKDMISDRELVFKRSIRIVLDESKLDADLQLEYCFASGFLHRLVSQMPLLVSSDKPYFYHLLVDLIAQVQSKSETLSVNRDDVGNYWLRLRNASPYRTNSFFSNVTIIAQNIRSLVRIVFAEKDEDFDAWYHYEWLSPFIKGVLAHQPLTAPLRFNKQASILSSFLKKFPKFFTQKPR
jgi:hypothetical protein